MQFDVVEITFVERFIIMANLANPLNRTLILATQRHCIGFETRNS